jgi:SpoVK/Ycf46/Vps4 family AAA+-type ATPase
MSFLLDRKREHERNATEAVRGKDFSRALFHAAQAAELGFQLAEQADGLIAEKYTEDAMGWIQMAKQLKVKAAEAPSASSTTGRKAVAASGGSEEDGKGQSSWQLKEKPKDRLEDVAGLADVKDQLKQLVIDPFKHPEVYQRFKAKIGGGVLMYGPPGNGKTFVARAVAGELDAAFFLVDASQIKDKYVGETEKKLTSLFNEARGTGKAVIFFDEVDDLLSQRGNQKIGTVNTFLKMADGFVKDDGCLLILAATNKPWMLSPAVLRPGRLGTHIYVGPPDQPAREAILKYSFGGAPVGEDVAFATLADKTGGYSGAELAEVCERAKRRAIKRQIESGQEESVTLEDVSTALEEVPAQTGPEQLRDFDRWKYSQGRGAGGGGAAAAAGGGSAERDEGDDE